MDIKLIIEIIGYTGSALVLVSMLMTSVVRLRIINLIGSLIFAGYALAIRSYPTAIMNICLAGINIFHLVRIFREERVYNLIKTDIKDGYFSYLLKRSMADIIYWFPELTPENIDGDIVYLVCCDDNPASLFIGKETEPGVVRVVLDYATPAYRDTSAGRFLNRCLKKDGCKELVFDQKSAGHVPYLEKMGYVTDSEGAYVLVL